MMQVLRSWFDRYFSDEQAVYLFLVLLSGLLVVVFFGRSLAPVLTAIVIAYLLQGLVGMLNRRGLSDTTSVYLVYFLFLAALVISLVVMLPLLWKQSVHLVQEQLPRLLANSETWLRALPQRYPELISVEQVEQLVAVAREELTAMGQAVLSVSLSSIPGLLDGLVFLVLLPLLVFFFLKDRRMLTGWAVSWLPTERGALASVWQEMDLQIANYVRGKAVEIIIVSVASMLAFYLLGLNYAFLLAILVGLSVVVPYIGATVVTLPVAAVGWVQFGFTTDFAMLMVCYGIIQFLDGNFLVPILFSEAVNLHPVAIITAILFFGGIWGLWGVFFAIPLATLIKAVL
ncbi:MAG: AI-2E family transporter, partial [Alcanivoracaceae bacterium]